MDPLLIGRGFEAVVNTFVGLLNRRRFDAEMFKTVVRLKAENIATGAVLVALLENATDEARALAKHTMEEQLKIIRRETPADHRWAIEQAEQAYADLLSASEPRAGTPS